MAFLVLGSTVVYALPYGVYGQWEGKWYWDTAYIGIVGGSEVYTWDYDNNQWNPTPTSHTGSFGAYNPNSALEFTLTLHDFDGEDYGEVDLSSDTILDGWVSGLSLEGGQLVITLSYGEGWLANAATISVGWNDAVGATLFGDFDEVSTPDVGWLSAQGTVELTNVNPTAPVPEPASMVLLGSGLLGLAGFRKKMKM